MGTLNPLHSELFANYLYIIYFKIMIFQKIVISQNSNASSSGLEEATKPPMGQWELWSSPRVVLGVFYLYNWPILCENSFFSVKSSMIESSFFKNFLVKSSGWPPWMDLAHQTLSNPHASEHYEWIQKRVKSQNLKFIFNSGGPEIDSRSIERRVNSRTYSSFKTGNFMSGAGTRNVLNRILFIIIIIFSTQKL